MKIKQYNEHLPFQGIKSKNIMTIKQYNEHLPFQGIDFKTIMKIKQYNEHLPFQDIMLNTGDEAGNNARTTNPRQNNDDLEDLYKPD